MYQVKCKYIESGNTYILGECDSLKEATDHKLRAMKKAAFQRCDITIVPTNSQIKTVDKPRLN
jgi:hypothetical protein